MKKRTKIIATISDRRCDVEFIRSLYEAGMNAVRINSAHVTTESAARVVENVRKVSDSIAIIIDTKGPEIRVTGMAQGYEEGIKVVEGDTICIKGTQTDEPSSKECVYVNDFSIYNDVPVGAAILIDDGELELDVMDKKDNELICTVKNHGVIKPRKSVNIPNVPINLPSVTERDYKFINWAIDMDVDFIAHSFVRKKEDVLAVKKIIKERNSTIKIISKIENQEGVNNIDEILDETYGIMVARGDLGVEIPAEKIPGTQRFLVNKCIESKTPVIIATQMLHTMISNPRPTRAEISDVANAIYQRVDAVMLSGETANGEYPVEAVETMARVAAEVEKDHSNPNIEMNLVRINNEITAQLCRSAGASAQLMAKEGKYAHLRLPSGEVRLVLAECRATIGQVGNLEHEIINIGKAGRTRWMGIRPTVRGSVMNPNDHPHGGGEGRAPVGRKSPMTPWGKKAFGLKTRKKKNITNKYIVTARKK